MKSKSASDTPSHSHQELSRLRRPLKLKLTKQGKHYLVVNYAEASGMTMEAAEAKVKKLFERGNVHVMQLYQLQSYVGDPSECYGTLIVPESIAPLTRTEALALSRA